MTVYLRALTFSERHVVDAIELDAEQQRFAGGSLNDIFRGLIANAHRAALHPFCLVADPAVVGFFVLRGGPARPVWALDNTITLHSFRVSKPFQGRGFGGAALRLAGQWIKAERPAISHLMLTVNADNPDASALYLRHGFHPTGITFQGRIGPERVMICPIDKIAGPRNSAGA
jgi:RimJ/RimL family protein N-acetyltransferase